MNQSRLARGRKLNNNKFKNSSSSSVSRSMFSGRLYHPSEAPPVFSGQPWNQIQLIITNPGAVKISTVKAALLAQTGCAGSEFEFRVQSFATWANVQKFSVSPIDLLRVPSDPGVELVNLVSTGMKNSFARVGYVYPQSIQQHVIYTKDTDQLLITVAPQALEMHFKILWKGADFKLKILEEICVSSASSFAGEVVDSSVQARLANIERLLQDARLNDG